MATQSISADDIAEKVFKKLSASRRRQFAPSREEDKAGDGIWNAYLDAVEDEDKASAESWSGSTAGILTFTGLFAATVAAFVIESYKQLQPDTGAQTVALLARIAFASSGNATIPPSELPAEPFVAPKSAVIVNSLWFLSLVISLACALLATLIQEWTRDFLRDIQRRTPDMTIKQYSFNHIYVRMGVERFKLDYVTSLIVALMHLAVVLFVVGLVIFLFPIHHTPAVVVEIAGIVAASIYAIFSLMPFFDNSCPYRTPLTFVFAVLGWIAFFILGATYLVVLWAGYSASMLVAGSVTAALGLAALVVGSLILASAVVFFGVRDGNWSWVKQFLPDQAIVREVSEETSKGFFTVLHFVSVQLPQAVSFYVRIWFPTRRRPGDKNVPADTPKDLDMFNLNDKDLEEARFINDKRISFLWDHTSNYLISREDNLELFLDHLPNHLLNVDHHRYGAFLSYLRHSSTFTERFAEGMTRFGSLEAGLGALKLLQELITAEHGLGYKFDPTHGERWKEMRTLIARLPIFLHRIMSYSRVGYPEDDINILLALSDLRWTLIRARFQSLQKMTQRDWASNVRFLNEMLLCLEGVGGFSLLPPYADSQRVLDHYSIDQNEDGDRSQAWRESEDILWGYELSLSNVLTLLANAIRLENTGLPKNLHVETSMACWRGLSSEMDFAAFSRSSRARQPSSQVISLLCSRGCGYDEVLDSLSSLFTVPNPPQLFRLELEANQKPLPTLQSGVTTHSALLDSSAPPRLGQSPNPEVTQGSCKTDGEAVAEDVLQVDEGHTPDDPPRH
ncbi:unnamed protein product [Peniophora sp. CBMAI 1063]|nr:unnamed protein product [Peniophora sp. CBMAI 1063]